MKNHHPVYFVCGTGRCGTSTVARILHESYGIHMGDVFYPPDHNAPLGYYEDAHIHALNRALASGQITYPQWIERTEYLIRKWEALDMPWGIKLAAHSHFLSQYLTWIPGPRRRIIRCIRSMPLVIRSAVRALGWESLAVARKKMKYKIRNINNILYGKDYHTVVFRYKQIPDKVIMSRLEDKWTDMKMIQKS